MTDQPTGMYLIYSYEHYGRLWKANESGYTNHLPDAGLYPADQAKQIIERTAIGWVPAEWACPPEIAIPLHWIALGNLRYTGARILVGAGWWRAILTAARCPDGTYLTSDNDWDQLWNMKISGIPDTPKWIMEPEQQCQELH